MDRGGEVEVRSWELRDKAPLHVRRGLLFLGEERVHHRGARGAQSERRVRRNVKSGAAWWVLSKKVSRLRRFMLERKQNSMVLTAIFWGI